MAYSTLCSAAAAQTGGTSSGVGRAATTDTTRYAQTGGTSSGVGRVLGRQNTVDPRAANELIAECAARVVSAESLQDGTALPALASAHCDSFLKLMGSKERLAPNRRVTIGTACTGSAADVLVFHALEAAYQAYVPSFEVAYEFNCESSAFKLRWGMTFHGLCSDKDKHCCWFKDIGCLHKGVATCAQHSKECPVPRVDIFVCATSCKDFSRANPNKRKRGAALAPPSGESARTLHGMNQFLSSHRPPLFLFENVDSIDSSHNSPASGPTDLPLASDMDIMLAHWAALGYECQRVVVNSREFGIPASRSRLLVIGVQTMANGAFDFSRRSLSCVFNTMRSLIQVCHRTHSCASGVLLPSTHPAVQAELARRQQFPTASGQRVSMGYNVGKAMEIAQARGVQWGSFSPSPIMRSDAWFQTLTKQQQDAACFSLKSRPDPVLFRDVSQSLGQTRLSSTRFAEGREEPTHCAATVLPAQSLMVFAPGQPFRLLLGREALVLQGFPSQDATLSKLIGSFSEVQMADLAGNMVSTPVMLAIAMAAISAVSWKDVSMSALPRTTAEDCSSAVSLLRSLMPQVRPLGPDSHPEPKRQRQ